MKAAEVRRLARDLDLNTLLACRDSVFSGSPFTVDVHGEDDGERLTHVLLAIRIAEAVADGAEFKSAFRDALGTVRTVLTDAED